MRQTWWHCLLVVAVAGVVFFFNLSGTHLWDRDEPRNAGCAAEMLQRGDWVVPVFNAELRTHKPVLLYWFMMAAYQVFGVNEFAARFWSAVMALGTALATYQIGRRLFNGSVGLWAALILSTALMFDVAARAATPDSVLIFFTTLALLIYVLGTFRSVEAPGPDPAPPELRDQDRYFPASWPVVALMYATMGFAVLAKGPVGLVLPTAVIGMFLLIMHLPPAPSTAMPSWRSRLFFYRRSFHPAHFLRTCWHMRPFTALGAASAVALPWYVWVAVRTDGEWIRGFFLTHNVHRAMHAMEGHHGPVFYYLIALALGFLPWSVLFGPTLIGLVGRVRWQDPWKAGILFAACWAGVYMGLFSLAQTKLPNYITPAYPAVALVTACYVYHFIRGTAVASPVLMQLALGVLALVGVALLAALPIAAHWYLPGEEWLGVVGLIPLAGAVCCFAFLKRGQRRQVMVTFAVMAVVLVASLFGLAAVRVDRHRQYDRMFAAINARGPEPRIASHGCLEPSWVFYAGRPIKELREPEPEQVASFLAGENTYLITTQSRYSQLRSALPASVTVLARAPYFLKNRELVVLVRNNMTTGTVPDAVAGHPPTRR